MNGWKFTAGAANISGIAAVGYNKGALVDCPSAASMGTGFTPTTLTTNLPGFGCYNDSSGSGGIARTIGFALNGSGAQSNISLASFYYTVSTGVTTAAFMTTSSQTNIGSGTLSGTITGDDGSSGTWTVTYSKQSSPFFDDNGFGSSYEPLSEGSVAVSGLTITNAVTYDVITSGSPAPVPAPTPIAIPDFCLASSNTVSFQTINGVNSYVFGSTYGKYGSSTGIFVLLSVPSTHPIAFYNTGKTTLLTYSGQFSAGKKQALDGNTYEYYYGDVTLVVSGDYGTTSYECFNHGYMGGQNNLVYNDFVCPPLGPPIVPPIEDPTKQYTLSYSEGVTGWPSFYSYNPDMMIGMNNYFYTFKRGQLYSHNTNPTRNNYYNVQYNSQITSVFNANALENKIFKTINLESDSSWTASLSTDIQTGGTINSEWFVKKEGAWFAFVRATQSEPAVAQAYSMRSVNGIGKSSFIADSGGSTQIGFSTSPYVSIGSEVSVGDLIYFSLSPYTTIDLAGEIININVDLSQSINTIVINTNIQGAVALSTQDPYIAYIKNQQAESHGMLGHYCLFTLKNTDTSATELFAVESEAMKSYP